MKKILFTIFMLFAVSLVMKAQSYQTLWKQVIQAKEKDQPRSELALLQKIITKAKKEKSYGNLLAAELRSGSLHVIISPDSLDNVKARLLSAAKKAEKNDKILAAVYNCALGRVLEQLNDTTAYQYADKSLKHPELLSQHKYSEYYPFIEKGNDDAIFNNDLLHVIGFEAEAYDKLSKYYKEHGNRSAACYTALQSINVAASSENELAELDALIKEYGDLPICAEVAYSRYQLMSNNDSSPKELYEYLLDAQKRWATWKRIGLFQNALDDLTYSSFSTSSEGSSDNLLPDNNNPLVLTLRNIKDLEVKLYPTSLGGDVLSSDIEEELDDIVEDTAEVKDTTDIDNFEPAILDNMDMAETVEVDSAEEDTVGAFSDTPLLTKYAKDVIQNKAITIRRKYANHPIYEEFNDTISFPKLAPGVYIMSMSSPSSKLEADQKFLFISNLTVIGEKLPNNQLRYIVVDKHSGQPIHNATIELSFHENDGKITKQTIKTDMKGEAFYHLTGKDPQSIYVYTRDDTSFEARSLYTNFYVNQTYYQNDNVEIFPDRKIYRPGQEVKVAAIVYSMKDSGKQRKPEAGKSFKLILRDASHKEVASKEVTTDDFGTASTSFVLPQGGLIGMFTLIAQGDHMNNRTYIHVEEYKRPTFTVTFDEYKDAYTVGDTIRIKGHARTYSGIGVQNAKVSYTVDRTIPMWFYWGGRSNDEVYHGEAITDTEGNFEAVVPLTIPDDKMKDWKKGKLTSNRFYNYKVEAKVTDIGGESHSGLINIPLSTKSTAFMCDMPDKIEDTKPIKVQFDYLNNAGQAIPGKVRYTIVAKNSNGGQQMYDGKYTSVSANKQIELGKLPSGSYLLHAICGTDTIDKDFIIFSLKDKRPVMKTHDWFYTSASSFPNDGKPVYVQIGSSDKDVHIVYSIVSSKAVLENGSFDLSNENSTRAYIYKEEYGDGITLNYAWVKEGKLYSHTVQLGRPTPDTQLHLSWKTFRNKLIPGQKEEWTLTIKRPDGKPANAQLLATLYDKSLDTFEKHSWPNFSTVGLQLPWLEWVMPSASFIDFNVGNSNTKDIDDLSFAHIGEEYIEGFDGEYLYRKPVAFMLAEKANNMVSAKNQAKTSNKMQAASNGMEAYARPTVKFSAPVIKEDKDTRPEADSVSVEEITPTNDQIRKNLNETAFFYPQLTTDEKGNVAIKFTLPESLTTWHFMGFAHDKDMNSGLLTDDVVAQKTLMVQPNLPRFLRQGDKSVIAVRLSNTSDKAVKANVKFELVDPATDKVVLSEKKRVLVDAKGTVSTSFNVSDETIKQYAGSSPEDYTLLVSRITAEGNGFSDGEQNYLPILPNKEFITNTLSLTLDKKGLTNIDLTKLFPLKGISNARLTVEYADDPTWLMIQTLPYMTAQSSDNAVDLANGYFANALGKYILNQTPKIRQVIELWKQEKGTETSLLSNLQKNQELKSAVLSETPWVMDANNEAEQKARLINFFDENTLEANQSTFINKLQRLQEPDGGFAWWPGMQSSLHMTVYAAKAFVRLQSLIGQDAFANAEVSSMLQDAFAFMDKKVANVVKEMKKNEKETKVMEVPSDELCDYLYISALAKRTKTADMEYLLDRLSTVPSGLTIYGKANVAVILTYFGRSQKANDYLKSIKEYTVFTPEMGRYFDTKMAYNSWRDYKIPSQVAAIEALKAMTPDDAYIPQMQRWLLQEKRTQMWDTPVNTLNAVWAFLKDGLFDASVHHNSPTSSSNIPSKASATFKLDGKPLNPSKATAGMGYVKLSETMVNLPHTLTIDKQTENMSFGGIYAQFMQPLSDVEASKSGIQVKREVLATNGSLADTEHLKVGDKVKVRLTITCDRDYDFIQIIDKRAACLEPINQLSGYYSWYYLSPKDNSTNYYFERMPKGKTVVETEYYIDRAGDYSSGTCSAQCAYSPEFSGRAKAMSMNVIE